MKSELKLSSVIIRLVSGDRHCCHFSHRARIFRRGPASFRQDREVLRGASVGVQSDTADSTAFAIGLYGDYYLTPNFSIGPLLQMGFTNDLSQFGLTAQAKYTFDIAGMPKLKPHVQAGLGLIYADLDEWQGGARMTPAILFPWGSALNTG